MPSIDDLLGESPNVVAVRETIRHLLAHGHRAGRLPPILLQGETGTGKGLVARLIYREGPRRNGPFVDVDCASIPETLLEAELFGFERGAFTNAQQAKAGLFQVAHRGTIFLDEVALLSEALQAKLLKVIDERAIRRLGSTRSESVDVWIISATNEDLLAAVRRRRFREDLYHRLAVMTLSVPPLRERGDDLLLLAEHFLSRACAAYDLPPKTLSADARAALLAYRWPGNIRELSNVVERVALLAEAPLITAIMLGLPESSESLAESAVPEDTVPFYERVVSAEREELLKALREMKWNISRAAARLGITRNMLRYRIVTHGLRSSGSPSRNQRSRRRPVPTPPLAIAESAPVEAVRRFATRWEPRYVALLRVDLLMSPSAPTPDTDRTLTVIADKIQSFGGCVQDLSPTVIVAAFGLEPIEDAPGRAALAAMAVRTAATRASTFDSGTPGVKAFVHVAQVIVGQLGRTLQIDLEGKRTAWAVLEAGASLGDTGGILVSDAAASFLGRRFELVSPRRLADASGHCYQLAGRERTGFGLGGRRLSRWVGRDRELEILRERLEQSARGRGQVVAVVGEPGVGKSRLLYEFRESLRRERITCLEGHCESYGSDIPYFAVIDLLKRYFQIDDHDGGLRILEKVTGKLLALDKALEPTISPILGLLDVPVDDPQWHALDPPQRRRRTLDAGTRFLVRESQVQSVLLMCEDLHWGDAETQRFLESLMASLPSTRLLLIVSYRPEYQHRWGGRTHYTEIRINPLPPERAEELLEPLLGHDPSLERLKRVLIERTDGNPFFLEESVHALVETNVLVGQRGGYRVARSLESIQVPKTVQGTLATRIDRLSPEDKGLLQSAAVIGRDIPFRLLLRIADVPEEALRTVLARLQDAEFLFETAFLPDLQYTFKHALTHEVAYGSLLPTRRRSLHAQIVGAIEQLYCDRVTEQVERLAHHAARGEIWEKAVTYLRQAGLKASTRSANREAVARFEEALVALAHVPETRETLEQAIDLRFDLRNPLVALGELERVVERLHQAGALAEALGDQRQLGWVASHMTTCFTFMGDQNSATKSGQRALGIATVLEDLALLVGTRYRLGIAYHLLGDYLRAAKFLSNNVESLQGDLLNERFGLALIPSVDSRAWLARCLAELGEVAQGYVRGDEAIRIAEAVDHAFSRIVAYIGVGSVCVITRNHHKAIPLLERGLKLCEFWDIPILFQGIASLLGYFYALAGRVTDGLPLLEQAVRQAASIKFMAGYSQRVAWLSEVYLLAGRREEAIASAQQALDLSLEHKERGHQAYVCRLLGEIASNLDPPDAENAVGHYRRALALAEKLGMRPLVAHCHAGLATLYRRTGKQDQAQEHFATATAMYREMGMPSLS